MMSMKITNIHARTHTHTHTHTHIHNHIFLWFIFLWPTAWILNIFKYVHTIVVCLCKHGKNSEHQRVAIQTHANIPMQYTLYTLTKFKMKNAPTYIHTYLQTYIYTYMKMNTNIYIPLIKYNLCNTHIAKQQFSSFVWSKF